MDQNSSRRRLTIPAVNRFELSVQAIKLRKVAPNFTRFVSAPTLDLTRRMTYLSSVPKEWFRRDMLGKISDEWCRESILGEQKRSGVQKNATYDDSRVSVHLLQKNKGGD